MSLTCTKYRCSSFLLFIFLPYISKSQNLFANPGFEDINICTENHAPCAPEAWYYIHPTTNPLVNYPASPLLGNNVLLVPVGNVYDTAGPRYFVYTMLTCPVKEGKTYKLSFYLNTNARKFYNLGLCFSKKEPASGDFNIGEETSIVTITGSGIVADIKLGWKAVEYTFTAEQDASFCMMGNMSRDIFPFVVKDKMSKSGNIYYFIDEIKLLPLEPGSPCAAYEDNMKKIYAQDHRHTEFELVDSIAGKISAPVFITDTITIPSALFATAKSTLTPAYIKIMDSIVNSIAEKQVERIDIIGHTDNKGTAGKNKQLSLERAMEVKNYFVAKLPRFSGNIFASGKGQDEPVAGNTTETGRAKNRRVEIVVTILNQKK